MRSLFITLLISVSLCSCDEAPTTITSTTKDVERSHPADFLKVNYEVRRNLVGKKVIEGTVLNTGKHLTYNSITLRIASTKDGDETSVNYTVTASIAPGGKAPFKYKPEGNPDRLKVAIASAIAD